MSIIDLIQGCDLQLDPLPNLKNVFDGYTDVFFLELEKEEESFSGKSDDSDTAQKLRKSIKRYQKEAEEMLDLYSKQMKQKRKNESAAAESLVVKNKASVELSKMSQKKEEESSLA